MNGLPDYYGHRYQATGPRRSMDDYGPDGPLTHNGAAGLDTTMMGGAQTLDQIINQNNQEMMRRRTTYQPQYSPTDQTPAHVRRASMLEFAGSLNHEQADFQFDPNPAHVAMSNQMANDTASPRHVDPRKVRSREDLSLDTRFSQMNSGFDAMHGVHSYSPNLMSSTGMNLISSSAYVPQQMNLSMDFDNVSGDVTPMNMPNSNNSANFFTQSPLQQPFPITYPPPNHDMTGPASRDPQPARTSSQPGVSEAQKMAGKQVRRAPTFPSPLSNSHPLDNGAMASPAQLQQPQPRRESLHEDPSPPSATAHPGVDQPGAQEPNEPAFPKFSNVYSSSGFDMLGVLMRVATRPAPTINIGPVDLSCAFVVCDLSKHDSPIVYCSEMFERLTGYTRYEILGRNCRFLQAPDGKVQSGVKRKYVDDDSVYYLKNKISKRAEGQLSLINYRKGGQPFMNLLTVIPIPWDTDECRYYVGFQVDLVEQPGSVSGKNPDGSYAINYQRAHLPRYVLQAPETSNALQADMGQTVGRDEVSAVLSSIGAGESELSKRIWDKVLLENTDDVVHVLSLKGLFLYLSPASRKVLEYDANELVGTALSSVCHPSDIVPVTRELKESSSGAAVNVVFRIRRKHSGYTWFESHGCLHTEQGKGRKCIILVGRERPVYTLHRDCTTTDGTSSESELWTKMSTSGMFLFVSSHVRSMIDRVPEDLVGTSMQALMRPESKKEFGNALEVARTGQKVTLKHDFQHRRGQILQAQTTLYPGDAQPGSKPTFLLGQTRLLKMSRAMLLNQKPSSGHSPRTDRASIGSATSSTFLSGPSSNPAPSRPSTTPKSSSSPPLKANAHVHITEPGSGGLALGNQDEALASEHNIFDELKTTRSTSWQFELRQMERQNRILNEELLTLQNRKKKRKRKRGLGQMEKDCANCHTRVTPEWRRGPSGNRDLCNSCGLRWAKQAGRVSPRKHSTQGSDKDSTSPRHNSSSDRTPVASIAGQANLPVPLATIMPKTGMASSSIGTMPAKIEEGHEPPHPHVLPT